MPPPAERSQNRTGAWLLLGGLAVLTVVVIGGVMKLRFDTGETYPHYSSLRSDPLGTRALYEALERTAGIQVERNFQRLDRLEGAPGNTLLLTGLDARQFSTPDTIDADAVSRFVVSGGRLVIALNPDVSMDRVSRAFRDAVDEKDEERQPEKAKEDTGKDKSSPPPAKPATPAPPKSKSESQDKAKADKKPGKPTLVQVRKVDPSFAETLKLAAKSKEFFYNGKEGSPLTLASGLPLKPEDVPNWRSNVYLDGSPDQDWTADWRTLSRNTKVAKPEVAPKKISEPSPWTTLASKGDRVMITSRRLGSGTVVVCTDHYFVSNEALWSEPRPAFLAWLLGDAVNKVIFDETHLGAFIGDEDGIMTLARRYRMHGLFLGGLLLFALFIWRSAFSLVPSDPDSDLGHWRADAIAGRSAASGLEGLLRRGVAASKLLQRCFEVWESSRASSSAIPAARRDQARALIADPQSAKRPVATYRAVRDTLHNARSPQPPS